MKIIQYILIFITLSLGSIKCYLYFQSIFPFQMKYLLWVLFISVCIGFSKKTIFAIATLLIGILGMLELTILKEMESSNPSIFELFYPLYLLLYDKEDNTKIIHALFNDSLTSFGFYVSITIWGTYQFLQQKSRVIKSKLF